MASTVEDVEEAEDQLMKEIKELGAKFAKAREDLEQARRLLYPRLRVANQERKVSLGRLHDMTGLTRGRIHQVVHMPGEVIPIDGKEPKSASEQPVQEPEQTEEESETQKSGWQV